MNYMLDTNICIYVIANRSVELVNKFRQMDKDDISVSVVVASELAYGDEGRPQRRLSLEPDLRKHLRHLHDDPEEQEVDLIADRLV